MSPLLWIAISAVSLAFLFPHFVANREEYSPTPGLRQRKPVFYFGTIEFFRRPTFFLSKVIEEAQDAIYAFSIRSSKVLILRGLDGRDAFFSKGLDFMSGYRLLVNPQLVDVMPVNELSGDESWASFMAKFIRSEVLQELYPQLLNDATKITETWGEQGIMDPFEDLYEVIFALSMRIGTCIEFCENPQTIKKIGQIFKDLEAGSSPSAILFPWFPTPARVRRTLAGAKLYSMISGVVQARKKQNRREDDPLQVLIDKDLSLVEITRFVAMLLFAAVTNTGNVLCWVLVYLENNREWKEQVHQEMKNFVDGASNDIDDFEQATPSFEPCINETLRLIFTGTFMRRNIGGELNVSGVSIPHGTYLMYPTADLHFDPRLFPDPNTFDPTRFNEDAVEERKKIGISFLGWGAARHTCVGKRAAFLMMRIVLMLIFTSYNIELVDTKGEPLADVPPTSHDVLFKVCPPNAANRVFMRYEKKGVSTQ